ncbi:MAG: uroporphyrinogen decarboxylase family protein [Sedimentisphaeraceae bacterium JB056]
MIDIPQSIKEQIKSPAPDFDAFKQVILGKAKPQKMHLCELFADQEVMQWVTENIFEKQWFPISDDMETQKKHLLCDIEYWHRMGYDYIHVVGGCRLSSIGSMLYTANTSDLSKGDRNWANMTNGVIKTVEDFEKIDWPKVTDEDLWMYDFVAQNLPEGMAILSCPESGYLEIPMEYLIGYEAMAMMSFENPKLLKMVFDKVRETINSAYAKIIKMDRVEGIFQGDDMGYKTSTMMSPDFLKEYSLPGHKEAAEIAHSEDKIYFMHSCGNLFEIMDYLIDEVKIDGKQSYEDIIMPVEDIYAKYSDRIAILGGLDVDILAGGSVEQTRTRAKEILEKCFNTGRFAMGSGNTITNYCKMENVLAMFDEAYTFLK